MSAPGHAVALYEVADMYLVALHDLTERDDLPDEVIADTLAALQGDLEVKGVSVAAYAKNLELEAELLKRRAKELTDRAKRSQAKSERLLAYLTHHLLRANVKRIGHGDMRVTVMKNPPSVNVVDQAKIPPDFWRIPDPAPPPAPEIDKPLIAAALKAGTEVPGCELLYGYRVKLD